MPVRTGSGRKLNQAWHIGAAQAFYHKAGTWFNRLQRFPGALCDPSGYIKFDTEEAYLNTLGVNVTQQTNVPAGIKALHGYVRMK